MSGWNPKAWARSFSARISPYRNRTFGPFGRFHAYDDDKSSNTMTRLASSVLQARVRFEPIAPAPPVTRTVLRRKVSEKSSISLSRPNLVLHPIHGALNPFLGRDLRVVFQIPNRLRAVHRFHPRRERLRVFVGDQ